MSFTPMARLFLVDPLAIMMLIWCGFLGSIIYFFSKRYMHGDSQYARFFRQFWLTLGSFVLLIVSDHWGLFLLAGLVCHGSLYRWLAYKTAWQAAVASSKLALIHWLSGMICTGLAFLLLYIPTRDFSIQNIVLNNDHSWYTQTALVLFFVGAILQSGTWPFHRWLISAQNAPTPIVAIMHGVVLNASAYLLIRLAPMYLCCPKILNMILVIGLCSTLLGLLWSRIHSDVKRTLACSTISHMGFVWVQFGLGLFIPALAYFFWQGVFKTSLFLASGGAGQEIRLVKSDNIRWMHYILPMFCGGLGAYTYAWMTGHAWIPLNTNLWIIGLIGLSVARFSLEIIAENNLKQLPSAVIASLVLPSLYAMNIHFFNGILPQVSSLATPTLSIFHIIGLAVFITAWIGVLYAQSMLNHPHCPHWVSHLYVRSFNASQPHPKTVTTYRKGYDYV